MKYKIIVDKQSSDNPSNQRKEYIVDIEELRVKGNVYDSLIITRNEDYVIRRLGLSEYHVLSILEEPIKEPLTDLNIELFEGDNYIYLMDIIGNKFYAEYIVKNEFTDIYVTKSEMTSSINESAEKIELAVNKKLTEYDTTEETNSKIEQMANSITNTISSVETKVESVNNTANSAKTAAETATGMANSAQSTANTAKSTADTAKETADSVNNNLTTNYYTKTETNSQIQQKADSITSTVSQQISTAKIEAINSANTSTNDKLKNYSTTSQVQSAIKQTADSINLEVSKKVGEDEIISKINQSAEEVQVDANKISFKRKRN